MNDIAPKERLEQCQAHVDSTCVCSKPPEALCDAEGMPLAGQHSLDHAMASCVEDSDACFWDDCASSHLYRLISHQAGRLQG